MTGFWSRPELWRACALASLAVIAASGQVRAASGTFQPQANVPGTTIMVPDGGTGAGGNPTVAPASAANPVPVSGTVTVDTSALATSAKQDTTNTDLGAPGATACATDTGSCSLNALIQRLAQRLTTAITALGTPLQAGGNVAVTGLPATPAGTNGIGNVGGKTVSVCVTPTVTASNAYGTNYVVGGLLTFNNAFTSTGSGILQSVVVTIKKVETSGFTFIPFNSNPTNTTWTDAAVAAINAADVAAVREPVSLTSNSQLGTHTVAYAAGIGQAMAPGTTAMYGVLIGNAPLTNQFGSTSDVQVCAKLLDDL